MALTVRPCRPMTLPRPSGCTRSCSTCTCDPSTDFTCTSAGWSTSALATASTSSFIGHLQSCVTPEADPSRSPKRDQRARTTEKNKPPAPGNGAPRQSRRRTKIRGALRLRDLLQTEKAAHRIAGLGAQTDPILDAFCVELDLRRLLQRIVRAHRFLHAAVPGPGPLNDHHAVKGLLFLPNPCQSNR